MLAKPALAVALLLAVGCATGCAPRLGRPLVTYSAGATELPRPITAGHEGAYGLYPADGLSPVEKVRLKRGQPLGFRRGNDGRVVGYAGDKEYDLAAVLAAEYVWKYLGKDQAAK